MTQTPQSIIDMFKKLGEDMKVPSVDMQKIVDHHRKNLEALAASSKAAAEKREGECWTPQVHTHTTHN